MAARSGEAFRRRIVAQVQAITPPGGHVLELSCGDGSILERLLDAGFEVEGTNFRRDPAASPRVPIRDGVDLTKLPLPFEDGSQQTVLLLDVIEHLPVQAALIGDLARIVRPGGALVLSTPNIQSVRSRLRFLCNGFFRTQRAFVPFDLPPEQAFEFHNYPVHLPTLLWQLRSQGFGAIETTAIGHRFKATLLWLLLWPVIHLSTRLKTHSREKYIRRSGASDLVYRALTNRHVLRGDTLVVTARRQAPVGAA